MSDDKSWSERFEALSDKHAEVHLKLAEVTRERDEDRVQLANLSEGLSDALQQRDQLAAQNAELRQRLTVSAMENERLREEVETLQDVIATARKGAE